MKTPCVGITMNYILMNRGSDFARCVGDTNAKLAINVTDKLEFDGENMVDFHFLKQDEFEQYANELFSILYDNMSQIAPTGNGREEDFLSWFEANKEGLKNTNRHIIISVRKETHEIVGYFQYTVQNNVLLMEEIQIRKTYQGKYNIFEKIYGLVLANMREDVHVVEAYANKKNTKSIGILGKLGLSIVGENKNGTSYHFRGTYADLLDWHKGINII